MSANTSALQPQSQQQPYNNGRAGGGGGAGAPALTPYDMQFTFIAQRINEDFDAIYLKADELDKAFRSISEILNAPKLDDTYNNENQERLQQQFNIVTGNLSFIYELLKDIVASFKKVDYPTEISMPNIAAPGQVAVTPRPQGILGRIQSFLGMFEDAQKKELEKSLAMFSGLIQQIGMCMERWDTFTMQHEEFSRFYERWGASVMNGYRNTERRNFRKVRNIIMPVIEGGLRNHVMTRTKDLVSMGTAITSAAGAKAADNAMFTAMGRGMGQALRPATMAGAGTAATQGHG